MAEDKKLIEEATRDVTELVVIDNDDVTRRKIMGFVEKYKLTSKIVSLSMTDVVRAFEMKYGLNISFDKEGKAFITKLKGAR